MGDNPVKSIISAKFSYGGVSDYPGSGFNETRSFRSESADESQAIGEFVDWVINVGAGVTAAITINPIPSALDPNGVLEFLLDQFLSFKITAKTSTVESAREELIRSAGYRLVLTIINGGAPQSLSDSFMDLATRCADEENPGPLLTEQISEYLS